MLANTAIFTCSICGEASTTICAYCTKDACANHQCARCKRCSDCCECEVPLSAEEPVAEEPMAAAETVTVAEPMMDAEPEPEAPVAEPWEARPGDPLLSPAEASVFRFEKREAIDLEEPEAGSADDPEETSE